MLKYLSPAIVLICKLHCPSAAAISLVHQYASLLQSSAVFWSSARSQGPLVAEQIVDFLLTSRIWGPNINKDSAAES